MMWLKTVSDDEAQGYPKEVFDQYRSRNGSVPNLHRVLANRPEIRSAGTAKNC